MPKTRKAPLTPAKKKKRLIILGSILGLLIILRIIFPYIVLSYLNKQLATMPGYYGHIQDLDIHLYRGAYTVKQIYLHELDSVTHVQTPFFASTAIDISIEWAAIFKGSIVGTLNFMEPVMRFTKDRVSPKQIKDDKGNFHDLISSFMPLRINRVEVHEGKLQYIDSSTAPIIHLEMDKTFVVATNLSNVEDSVILLPSTVLAHANIYGGEMHFGMKLNALAKDPTFELHCEVLKVPLVNLNPLLRTLANVDVNKGRLEIFTEFAAKDGKFKGYVKPLIKDIDVLGPEDKKKSFPQKVYEGVVGTAADILKNPKTKDLGSKVPIEGTFGNSNTDVMTIIVEVLRNAFIEALKPAIDNTVTINSVGKPEKKKGFFEQLFGGSKSKKK